MVKSMQPAIQAVERIVPSTEITPQRIAYSYRRGYEDGHTAGKRSAYRRMGWIAAAFVLAGALAALVT